MKKRKAKMINGWGVARECVENGVSYGHRRAYKHTNTPSEEMIQDQITEAVLNFLSERFAFGDEEFELPE